MSHTYLASPVACFQSTNFIQGKDFEYLSTAMSGVADDDNPEEEEVNLAKQPMKTSPPRGREVHSEHSTDIEEGIWDTPDPESGDKRRSRSPLSRKQKKRLKRASEKKSQPKKDKEESKPKHPKFSDLELVPATLYDQESLEDRMSVGIDLELALKPEVETFVAQAALFGQMMEASGRDTATFRREGYLGIVGSLRPHPVPVDRKKCREKPPPAANKQTQDPPQDTPAASKEKEASAWISMTKEEVAALLRGVIKGEGLEFSLPKDPSGTLEVNLTWDFIKVNLKTHGNRKSMLKAHFKSRGSLNRALSLYDFN